MSETTLKAQGDISNIRCDGRVHRDHPAEICGIPAKKSEKSSNFSAWQAIVRTLCTTFPQACPQAPNSPTRIMGTPWTCMDHQVKKGEGHEGAETPKGLRAPKRHVNFCGMTGRGYLGSLVKFISPE